MKPRVVRPSQIVKNVAAWHHNVFLIDIHNTAIRAWTVWRYNQVLKRLDVKITKETIDKHDNFQGRNK